MGKETSEGQWLNWHNLFMEGSGLAGRLARIHKLSTVQTATSELRIMDAILWRYSKDQGITGGRAIEQTRNHQLKQARKRTAGQARS